MCLSHPLTHRRRVGGGGPTDELIRSSSDIPSRVPGAVMIQCVTRSPAHWAAMRLCGALATAWLPSAMAARVDVAEELERLAAANGFEVVGLQHTTDAMNRVDADELYPRLRQLLEKFNTVIVQRPGGGIERVIILGAKVPIEAPPAAPAPPPGQAATDEAAGDIHVQTVRRGTSHSVQASLEGGAGQRIQRTLVVDTGADLVVLPASLLNGLGLSTKDLQEREMQTANGKVPARIGTLPALWLGNTRIAGVEVAFIDDAKLGENALLGMSVLGRYRMTIDDEHGLLTLGGK
jgi:aspartyl protease family protein